jgi:hypothetical protein
VAHVLGGQCLQDGRFAGIVLDQFSKLIVK